MPISYSIKLVLIAILIMVKKMNHNAYYYKGYDVTNKNRFERLAMEYDNPYGYNFLANTRRIVDKELKYSQINEDYVKNKEFNDKKS